MVKKILKSYDYTLVIAIILLCAFGLVMIYSASMAYAVERYEVASDFFYQRQKGFLLLFALIFIVAAIIPYKIMRSTKWFQIPMVVLSIGALIGIFFFGVEKNNAQSWYQIGSFLIQPAEFVKLTIIIYLAAVYAKKQSYINQLNIGIIPPIVLLLIICFLIKEQPDFGSAAIIFAIASTIIFSSGMNLKSLMKLGILAIIILSLVMLIYKGDFFSSVQKSRFEVLGNPFDEKYIETTGYHLANSYIAIGSGGINGLGLGKSVQKLGYLPESHTDFIMAVIAEELGIWGVGFVILLLAYVVLRGIYIGLQCKDPFGSLLAIGVSSMIGIQSFINLAGVSGLIPLTGVPLPFVSYGGSSILMLAAATGILVNVSMFVKYEKKYKSDKSKVEKKENVREGNVFYL